jgi:gamma-glutamyl-gamma-aminobutyrate hydrolase PuuD
VTKSPTVLIFDPFAESFVEMFEKHGWGVAIAKKDQSSSEVLIQHFVSKKNRPPDAILFTGGSDIDPQAYDEKPIAEAGPFDTDRDNRELWIAGHYAIPNKLKLGVCRGLQLLHVHNNGTLNQDIPGHRYSYARIGTEIGDVRTCGDHHQSLRPDAKGDPHYIAYDPTDGTIEAVVYPKTKCFGVQFHPEWGPDEAQDYFFWVITKYFPEVYA